MVQDTTGAALPGVTVTVTQLETGARRVLTTSADGSYRALLLPLGSYRVRAELTGFKVVERTGVSLSAGQTAMVDVTLEVGGVTEVVTVSGDSPVAQPGKIDLGRTISQAEIKNLPLVSRNPYNFAFLQANVTGYENNEFGVPRINANGSQMHTNYQIDGNTNTQKDRAGLRMLPISEVVVREVKVITSGFAPEFGQTTGMVFNAVTPSGTNDMRGLPDLPFPARGDERAAVLPVPRRAHARQQHRQLHRHAGRADRLGQVALLPRLRVRGPGPARRVQGDPAERGQQRPGPRLVVDRDPRRTASSPPSSTSTSRSPRPTTRSPPSTSSRRATSSSRTSPPTTSAGGLNTVERATDFNDRMDSASVQLISSFGASRLNELRVQFARRHQFRTTSENAGACPAIVVSGIADFGCPLDATQSAGFDFSQKIWQVSDNFTWIRGKHSVKAGFDLQFVADDRVNTLRQIYTFPSVDAYLAAKAGTNPRAYTTFQQDLGDPSVSYNSGFYAALRPGRLPRQLELQASLRAPLRPVRHPGLAAVRANPLSQSFKKDKNNFAPRVGFSWSLDSASRTVVRASTGIMYEPPLLNLYEDAILRNGDPRSFTATLNPTSAGAPAFPATLADLPPGFTLPTQSINAVAADFDSQWALMTNVQIERAIGQDFAVSLGYVNSTGRSMPALIDTNIIPTGLTLGDGRPIYSTAVNAQTRVNPAFNHIDTLSSTGEGSYNAFTLSLNKRMSHGVQLQASYTWAKGEDDAPLTGTYVVGSGDDRLSDPSNQGRDKGWVPFNQTHTFVMSTLLAPRVSGTSIWDRLADNNQLGLILIWNSGLPFNIRSNLDLNQDGLTNDRPLDIDRNAGRFGQVVNLDARYVRFIPLGARFKAELFVEAKNVFNTGCSVPEEYATCTINISAVNRVVTTNAAGQPAAAIPDPFAGTAGYQQRQVQLGVKVSF